MFYEDGTYLLRHKFIAFGGLIQWSLTYTYVYVCMRVCILVCVLLRMCMCICILALLSKHIFSWYYDFVLHNTVGRTAKDVAWFQASTALQMRAGLFCDFTQRRMVVIHGRCGTTYRVRNVGKKTTILGSIKFQKSADLVYRLHSLVCPKHT
jgi:hypothetical protein